MPNAGYGAVTRASAPPPCPLQLIGGEAPDAAPVPLRFRQFLRHHLCGTRRVPGLAQVLGDDGRAANVDQERPAEVELPLVGWPDRKRLAEAELGILTRVAGLRMAGQILVSPALSCVVSSAPARRARLAARVRPRCRGSGAARSTRRRTPPAPAGSHLAAGRSLPDGRTRPPVLAGSPLSPPPGRTG